MTNIDMRFAGSLAVLLWVFFTLSLFGPVLVRRLRGALPILHRSPRRCLIGLLAGLALVAFGGTKPKEPTYEVSYVDNGQVLSSQSCMTNCVYSLRPPASEHAGTFVGWRGSNGRLYENGILFFDLAKPGEKITMTAVWK